MRYKFQRPEEKTRTARQRLRDAAGGFLLSLAVTGSAGLGELAGRTVLQESTPDLEDPNKPLYSKSEGIVKRALELYHEGKFEAELAQIPTDGGVDPYLESVLRKNIEYINKDPGGTTLAPQKQIDPNDCYLESALTNEESSSSGIVVRDAKGIPEYNYLSYNVLTEEESVLGRSNSFSLEMVIRDAVKKGINPVNMVYASSISQRGIDFIKKTEDFSPKPYPDSEGISIGYGHQIRPGENLTNITREQADKLFEKDLELRYEACIQEKVKVPLTQDQYNALCSFVYNVGTAAFEKSTLLRKLNKGDYTGASEEFGRWANDSVVKNGKTIKVKLPALVERREKEKKMFLSDYSNNN